MKLPDFRTLLYLRDHPKLQNWSSKMSTIELKSSKYQKLILEKIDEVDELIQF